MKGNSYKKYWLLFFLFAGIVFGFLLFYYMNDSFKVAESPNATTAPNFVLIDAGSPLTCTIMENPRVIGEVMTTYSCSVSGAFLESINLGNNTALYFTTNTQGDEVTYGPESVNILEVTN